MERVVPINKTFQDFFGFHFLLRMERKEEERQKVPSFLPWKCYLLLQLEEAYKIGRSIK